MRIDNDVFPQKPNSNFLVKLLFFPMKKRLLPLLGLLLVASQTFATPTPSTAVTRPPASRLANYGTRTSVVSSPNPSTVGTSVTFTATVRSADFFGPSTINEGTVTFSEGATVLAADVPVTSNVASFSTAALTAGTHLITVTYNGTANLGTSSRLIYQTVDDPGSCPTFTDNTAYVNASASVGTNDGTTWARAFLTLQAALDAARTCGVTQIWVAQGTYVPSASPPGASTAQPLTSADFSFHLVDGVAIYGGFSGTETQLSQRNWRQYPTILSGSNARNHVVTSANDGLATRLDGFTITGGRAGGFTEFTVEGQSFGGTQGAGMYLQSSSVTLSNLLITGNSCPSTDNSGGQGGGMAMVGGASVLTNVAFVGNSAYAGGGFSGGSAYTMTNCVFFGNTANAGGGGMITGGSPTLTNVVFANNAATRTGDFPARGGAMTNGGGTFTLINCTFFGNTAPGLGGTMYNVNGATVNDKNGIYFNNTNNGNTAYNGVHNFTPSFDSFNATTTRSGDPTFVNSADPDGPDNQWMTEDDGLSIASNSPAINAGTAAGAPTTDIRGFARTGNPDQGAYEYTPCVPPTAFTVTGGGSLCAGGSGLAVGLNGSESGISYQLKRDGNDVGSAVPGDGQGLSFGTFTTAGTYTVVAIRSSSCTATMTGSPTVTVNPLPTPTVTPDGPTTFCAGGSVGLSAGSFSGYVWKRDNVQVGTEATYTATASGSYTVTVTDGNGCQGTSDPVTVTVNPNPSVSNATASPNPVCQGQTLTLSATASGGTGNLTYAWGGPNSYSASTNPATRTVGTGDGGVYNVTVTDQNQCQASGQTASVSVQSLATALPKPTVQAGAGVCAGQNLTLSFQLEGCITGSLTAQLSDKDGNFATPTATWPVAPGSPVVALPLNLPSGEGYRVRLVSTAPSLTSPVSEPFKITALSVALYPATPGTLCQGQDLPVTFSTLGGCSFPQGNTFTVQLSNATGSFANPRTLGTAQPGTTTFPASALSGLPVGNGYRVRIVSSNPALTSFASAPFDLRGPTVSTVTPGVGGVPSGGICRGSQVTVSFNFSAGSCAFPGGNAFTAQLSSASGSFTSPVSLGTVQAGVANSVTIPAGTVAGTGYRIRVVSSNPATASLVSSPFRVNAVGCNGRMVAEEAGLEVVPNPVVGGEIRVRVSGLDNPHFSLTNPAGRSVGISVKTDGSGEFVLTPKQALPSGVYVLGASEGTVRLTRRVLVSE